MNEKKNLGHDRAILLQTLSQKDLSENTELRISQIIKRTVLKYGSEAADRKAAELTELINRCKTEAEILKAINNMR